MNENREATPWGARSGGPAERAAQPHDGVWTAVPDVSPWRRGVRQPRPQPVVKDESPREHG